jgi:formamidopyrimidine-DNA glycosylase
MPELPEVETIARGLAAHLNGRTISAVRIHRSDILHGNIRPVERLTGRRIAEVIRCGKQIRMNLRPEPAGAFTLFVHLGMTGQLLVLDRDRPLAPHTHVQLQLAGRRSELRFCDPRRFGGIWLVADSRSAHDPWRGRPQPPVGADPLSITEVELAGLLKRRRQIKALLMDQDPISGLGNIYCDEILYRAGIHPLTPAADLPAERIRRLHRTIRRVLAEAIRAGGSSISDYRDADNAPGSYQERHRVYGRTGQACRACGTPIERLVVAGRGTHICRCCQPPPGGKRPAPRV